MSILTAEYDFDTAMAVKQEEAYEEGISIGLATGREEGISIGLERGRLEGQEQGRLEGLERGAYQTKLETAKSMLALGLHLDQIQLCTSLPLETVLELVQGN